MSYQQAKKAMKHELWLIKCDLVELSEMNEETLFWGNGDVWVEGGDLSEYVSLVEKMTKEPCHDLWDILGCFNCIELEKNRSVKNGS